MCISATSSFVVAGGLTLVGAGALRRTRYDEHRMFAALPFLFAAQQALEGIVWLTLDARTWLHNLGAYGFLFFAFIVFPIYVPLSIRRFERVPWRQMLLLGITIVGGGIGLTALYAMIVDGVVASVANHHISYSLALTQTKTIGLMACSMVFIGSLYASSQRILWAGGLGVIGLVAYTYLAVPEAVVSMWCFLAGVLSILLWWAVPRLR